MQREAYLSYLLKTANRPRSARKVIFNNKIMTIRVIVICGYLETSERAVNFKS